MESDLALYTYKKIQLQSLTISKYLITNKAYDKVM